MTGCRCGGFKSKNSNAAFQNSLAWAPPNQRMEQSSLSLPQSALQTSSPHDELDGRCSRCSLSNSCRTLVSLRKYQIFPTPMPENHQCLAAVMVVGRMRSAWGGIDTSRTSCSFHWFDPSSIKSETNWTGVSVKHLVGFRDASAQSIYHDKLRLCIHYQLFLLNPTWGHLFLAQELARSATHPKGNLFATFLTQ